MDACLDVGGMCRIWSGSMASWMRGASPPVTALTRPICTPRILTRELGSSTRPERSAVRVTGTVGVNVLLNMARLSTTAATMPVTSNIAHHPGEIRRAPVPSAMRLTPRS